MIHVGELPLLVVATQYSGTTSSNDISSHGSVNGSVNSDASNLLEVKQRFIEAVDGVATIRSPPTQLFVKVLPPLLLPRASSSLYLRPTALNPSELQILKNTYAITRFNP